MSSKIPRKAHGYTLRLITIQDYFRKNVLDKISIRKSHKNSNMDKT